MSDAVEKQGEPAAGPLTGVRVVDLTSTLMGPYCTLLLSQMGAEIIKVESPSGDPSRYLDDKRGNGMGPIFLGANRGKRSITLDLKRPGARDVLDRILGQADALVHSLRPDGARRLRVDPETIHAEHPSLVYCALQGYGSVGPYRNRAAYDDVIQSSSGLTAVQGLSGPPQYIRTPISDKTVGLVGVGAICAALFRRERSGAGQVLEVPMLESMVAYTLLDQQGGYVYDPPAGPTGYSRTASLFRKPYQTADGFISVMVYTDAQWASFFDLIGRPELAESSAYRTITERTNNIDKLYQLVEESLPARTTAEWLHEFDEAGIAGSRVYTLAELFEDEHLQAVGMFPRSHHPTEGTLRLPRAPLTVNGSVPGNSRPAPRLGEHSDEVLREAGYLRAEIDSLRRAGIVGAGCPRAAAPLVSQEAGGD
jgi:crotonobetainyl-CoA:carnitine CoA-transferase CaiB-like acyl-CoA transferase